MEAEMSKQEADDIKTKETFSILQQRIRFGFALLDIKYYGIV